VRPESAYAAKVVAAVRGYLEAACREPPSGDEGVAAAPSEEPGWHPYVPKGSSSPVMVGNRPWTRLRLVDVVHADGLILVLFAARDGGGNHDDGDVYLYGERLAGYEELGMSADQAAGMITIHLDELLGTGWENVWPMVRLGRLVVLAVRALAPGPGASSPAHPSG
jgi:hypothetical protein